MRKRFCGTLVLLLALLLYAAPAHAAALTFTDVPETKWAYENIRLATERGLISGVSSTRFGLGEKVTRAQFAMMLCRLMGWEMVTPTKGSFTDNQNTGTWYYSAIETAYANGALLKLGGACGPTEPLLREEMAAMAVRALGYSSLAGVVQNDCPFDDVVTNPGYVTMAYHMGFMTGLSEGKFSPRAASTREQAATVLLRLYDRLHGDTARSEEKAPAGAVAVHERTGMETPLPMSPRAPLEDVYDAAVQAGEGGAVTFSAAPTLQTVKNGTVSRPETISVEKLGTLLAASGTKTNRSARYQSSYLTSTAKDGTVIVVWYESEKDLDVKVELCRLLGVKTVYITR